MAPVPQLPPFVSSNSLPNRSAVYSNSGPRRIFHAVFSSGIAGAERYCTDLANRQAALGYEVHVAGKNSSPLRHALVPAVRFHSVGSFFRVFSLRRLLAEIRPDICHGHLSAACKALGRLSSCYTTVATLHVGYKRRQHQQLGGLICVNQAQASRLASYDGSVRTIANWLPAAPKIAPPGIREELGIAPGVFLVGAVGRLHESKGNDVLISAFKATAPANAALVILGEGKQRSQLEKLRAGDSRIHLLGYRPVVHGFLGDLDLFVSPSREESFGLAIVEAMSMGLPIIATAAEGPAEFLRHQPVTLVPPGSVEALATALTSAHRQFVEGNLTHPAYDLRLFDPHMRIGNIMDFYGEMMEARQPVWAPVSARRVAVAT